MSAIAVILRMPGFIRPAVCISPRILFLSGWSGKPGLGAGAAAEEALFPEYKGDLLPLGRQDVADLIIRYCLIVPVLSLNRNHAEIAALQPLIDSFGADLLLRGAAVTRVSGMGHSCEGQ